MIRLSTIERGRSFSGWLASSASLMPEMFRSVHAASSTKAETHCGMSMKRSR